MFWVVKRHDLTGFFQEHSGCCSQNRLKGKHELTWETSQDTPAVAQLGGVVVWTDCQQWR